MLKRMKWIYIEAKYYLLPSLKYGGDLPTVDDDVHTGVENQQEVGEVGQYVTPILICNFFNF